MLDHGQLGPATPAARSPASSRRPSALSSHRPSISQARPHISAVTDSRPRRPSLLSFGDSLSMSALDTGEDALAVDGETTAKPKHSPSPTALTSSLTRRVSVDRPTLRNLTHMSGDPLLSMSALEDSDDDDVADMTGRTSYIHNPASISDETARILGRRMSDAMLSSPVEVKTRFSEKGDDQQDTSEDDRPSIPEHHPPTYLASPAELAAQLHANPKLAALRSPMAMTPLQSASKTTSPISPPILMNPKCSGYFVEPVCGHLSIVAPVADIPDIDEMDGTFPGVGAVSGEDHLSKYEMWSETWELRLGRCVLWLQGMGDPCSYLIDLCISDDSLCC